MIRSLIALVPPAHRSLLPRYAAALVILAVAQGIAYAMLAPLLEAVFDDRLNQAWTWLAGIGVALIVVAVASYQQAMIGLNIGIGMLRDLQMRLGDHLATLPLGWFGPATAGRASRVIVSSTREVMGVFAHLVAPLVTAIIVPTTVAVAMLFVDWRVSVAVVIAAPVLYLVNRWGNSLYGRAAVGSHAAAAEANARVLEFAQAQPVLRAFGAVEHGSGQLADALDRQRKAGRTSILAAVPSLFLFAFVVQLAFILLVWLVLSLATGGDLSPAVAIALIAVGSRFIEPVAQAADMSTAIRGAAVAADRINDLLNTPAVVEPEQSAQPRDTGLRFDGVTFGYRKDDPTPVLSDVSFTAAPGTTTAIVGPSGSGKTTLLRLAARFYDVDSGTVEFGGHDVRDYHSGVLLSRISPVFQDVYLFDQSVIDNIRIGRPDADDAEVLQAARSARVDEIVDPLPDGWDTRVGEGGAALSGGERQRVSIARALLKAAPVVLLDEATSALDPAGEAAVVRGVRELTAGATVLVVAHRLSTIRHADRILFLERGRIVEEGTHDELLALAGRYAAFWNERSRAAGWRLAPTG